MKVKFFIGAILISLCAFGQIATEGFENTTYFSMSSTGTLSAFKSGNSAAGDLPASSPLAVAGTYAYGVNNGTTTLISETYDTRCYTSVTMQFRLASFSYGTNTNGADAADNVVVSVSTDGGSTYATELTVNGNTNASWSYAGGTGIASAVYGTPATFAPGGGGNRGADGYSTLKITSLPNTATLVIKIVALNNSANELWAIDDFKITGTANTGASAPTAPTGITFTEVGCNAFMVSWTDGTGNSDLVAVKSGSAVTGSPTLGTGYTLTNSNGALFGIGSTLNAGEYVVFNSTGGSVLVYGLNPSTTYYVSIWESNCFKYNATALTGNVTTGSCSFCPQMNSVFVDGCNTSCGVGTEGETEMAFFNSGSYTIPVNTNAVGYNFDQVVNPPTQSYAENIVANPTAITSMNTAGGCGTLFVDASVAGYIPQYSTFVILNNNFCATDYNFSSLCPLAPIYVMFTTSQNWNTGGNYTNHNCTSSPNNKYWFTDFSEAGISCVHYYYYDACTLPNGDGAYILYDNSQPGNLTSGTTLAPNTYGPAGGCSLPIVLPVSLIEFKAELIDATTSKIKFVIADEENVKQYIISKSVDGFNFSVLDRQVSLNRMQPTDYFSYDRVNSEINEYVYYRLEEMDLNGVRKNIGTCLVRLKPGQEISISQFESTISITMPVPASSIELMSADGKSISYITGNANDLSYQIEMEGIAKGFYIIRVRDINEKITIKKIIQ